MIKARFGWVTLAMFGMVTTAACSVQTEPGSSSGSSGSSGAQSSSGGGSQGGGSSSSSGGSSSGATADAGGKTSEGVLAVGDAINVEINTKQPVFDIPTYGKEHGHRFVIELASDKETTITLCPQKGTDTPSTLYMHSEADEKDITYGAQRPGYDYTGSSLGKFRPKQSGKFVIYASNKAQGLRDTGGAYVLKAALSTDDNDACPR